MHYQVNFSNHCTTLKTSNSKTYCPQFDPTVSLLLVAISYKVGKEDLREELESQGFVQKQTLVASPILSIQFYPKNSFKIAFQNPTPNAPLSYIDLQPRPSTTYLAWINFFQLQSETKQISKTHLPKRVWLNRFNFLKSNMPWSFSEHTTYQLTCHQIPMDFINSNHTKELGLGKNGLVGLSVYFYTQIDDNPYGFLHSFKKFKIRGPLSPCIFFLLQWSLSLA